MQSAQYVARILVVLCCIHPLVHAAGGDTRSPLLLVWVMTRVPQCGANHSMILHLTTLNWVQLTTPALPACLSAGLMPRQKENQHQYMSPK